MVVLNVEALDGHRHFPADFRGRGVSAGRREGALPGVAGMVADEREVLYGRAFGVGDIDTGRPLRVDDVFFIASMTKAITSLACAQVIEQARLGLEDDAAALVPRMVAKVLTGFDANGQPILREPRRKG